MQMLKRFTLSLAITLGTLLGFCGLTAEPAHAQLYTYPSGCLAETGGTAYIWPAQDHNGNYYLYNCYNGAADVNNIANNMMTPLQNVGSRPTPNGNSTLQSTLQSNRTTVFVLPNWSTYYSEFHGTSWYFAGCYNAGQGVGDGCEYTATVSGTTFYVIIVMGYPNGLGTADYSNYDADEIVYHETGHAVDAQNPYSGGNASNSSAYQNLVMEDLHNFDYNPDGTKRDPCAANSSGQAGPFLNLKDPSHNGDYFCVYQTNKWVINPTDWGSYTSGGHYNSWILQQVGDTYNGDYYHLFATAYQWSELFADQLYWTGQKKSTLGGMPNYPDPRNQSMRLFFQTVSSGQPQYFGCSQAWLLNLWTNTSNPPTGEPSACSASLNGYTAFK